jgi:2-phosphosulfolactate phosphatase
MKIDVLLLPGQPYDPARSVCVIVDVLRASSSIVTMLDRGAECVAAAADVEDALRLHRRLSSYILCGERDGLPPKGFDYGNSPAEFSRLDLREKAAILATSNGTRILTALADRSPAVVVGSLLNRTAAARAAVQIATERGLDVALVCSAAYGGSGFVLEDALGAGAIADAAGRLPGGPELSDAARFAAGAFRAASAGLPEALRSAYHARELVQAGLGQDVEYCARLDVSEAAPVLERGEDGVLLLRRWGS